MQIRKQIEDGVKHYPQSIPLILNKSKDPMYTSMVHGILNGFISRDVGLEIELIGSLRKALGLTFEQIKAKYSLQSYSEDGNLDRFGYNETRIRFKGYKGLVGLANILDDLRIHCTLNIKSGIHYNIGITPYEYSKISNYIRKYLDGRVYKSAMSNDFSESFKILDSWNYVGNYNTKTIGEDKSSRWINLRRDTNISYLTDDEFRQLSLIRGRRMSHIKHINSNERVEIRIGEMTFDYDLIISRILDCHKVVRALLRGK